MILKTTGKVSGFALIITVLAACSQLKEKPVVDFVMKDFKAESSPNCKGDSTCVLFEVQYPEFLGLDTAVRKAITDRVNYILNGSTGEPVSLDQMANELIKDYEDFRKDMPEFDLGWYFRGKVKVLISSDTLISLQVDTDEFTGAAHSTYTTHFVNVEPKTGTAFLLDAMLRPGYQEELGRLGREELRNQLELAQNDSLPLPEGEEGFPELTDNYGFRKEGIVFFFNDYMAGAMADGSTEIIIPYEKLRDWMK